MATTSYVDLGAVQQKRSGTPTANTSYVDLGAAQLPVDTGGTDLSVTIQEPVLGSSLF